MPLSIFRFTWDPGAVKSTQNHMPRTATGLGLSHAKGYHSHTDMLKGATRHQPASSVRNVHIRNTGPSSPTSRQNHSPSVSYLSLFPHYLHTATDKILEPKKWLTQKFHRLAEFRKLLLVVVVVG